MDTKMNADKLAALQARCARLAAEATETAAAAGDMAAVAEAREADLRERERRIEERDAAYAREALERQQTETAIRRRVRNAEEKHMAVAVGMVRKEAAIAAVHRASTDGAWKVDFLARFKELIARGDRFTTDDVLEYVGYPPSGKPQIIGAAANAAVKKHQPQVVGMQPSSRATRNGTKIQVWQSAATAYRRFASL
ncbi:hypothetical protein [Kineococcus rhizosphaerae]|uniref:Uncharacterized protein n=1 Tax=Kineococcus rhizosphaerae TaxID=559628 RepID=A0A2T0QTK8_9ACTN|nr:hypothetical protein [Kineococcus rhizosphaerae]PRY08415.1 hypothetical protein CLV37_12410 [Kineococcus rhizosphaerae]